MTTYLSIDFDFFNDNNFELVEKTLRNVIEKSIELKIPIISVMNHHQLLSHVDNAFKNHNNCTLINVDYHADICSSIDLEWFNCGTWISYVKNRSNFDYIWIYPNNPRFKTYNGSCQTEDKNIPWDYQVDWKSVIGKSCSINKIPLLVTQEVIEIGLCMSPWWSHTHQQALFYDLVREYKIPYKKGKLDEGGYIIRKPPKV